MNRLVLITGASSGIGKGLKEYFLNCNDEVIDLSRRSEKYPCDITDKAALDQVFEKLSDKRIDILINCAGQGLSGAVELVSDEEIKKQFDLNFFALVDVTKSST